MTHPILSIPSFRDIPLAEVQEVLRARDSVWCEIRYDALTPDDYPAATELAREFGPRMIATCRCQDEGGQADMPDEKRMQFLAKAVQAGIRTIDWEWASRDRLDELRGMLESINSDPLQWIFSSHDFAHCPAMDELADRADAMHESGAGIVKFAVTPSTSAELLGLLNLQCRFREKRIPSMVLGMGAIGRATRIAAPLTGAWGTFTAWSPALATAGGQITLDDALTLYRIPEVGPDWELLGVIGHPIHHSRSPQLHNNLYAALSRKALYVPFDVPDDPAGFITGLMASPLRLRGLSVTVPHKVDVLAVVREPDGPVKAIGAANTLVVHRPATDEDQAATYLSAHNTDATGLCQAIRDGVVDVRDAGGSRRAVVLGAGGAARGAVFGLKQDGWDVYIANRTRSKAEGIAWESGTQVVDVDEIPQLNPGLLVNATTVGMAPLEKETPVPAKYLTPGCLVFDMVYQPLETRLLREARESGLVGLEGWRMLVAQGVAQHQIWFPSQRTDRELFNMAMGPEDRRLFPESKVTQ